MQRALDVDAHDAVPERVVDRGELGARVDPRVGGQDVDAAEGRERRRAIASTEARTVTSVATASAPRPSSAAVRSAAAASMSAMTTRAPSAASTDAMPRPMPRAAP